MKVIPLTRCVLPVALGLSLCVILAVSAWKIIIGYGIYCPSECTPLEKAACLHRWGHPEAIENAQMCVRELLPQAERIQSELASSNLPLPPRTINFETIAASYEDPYGKDYAEFAREFTEFIDNGANEILARGPLNDAALCQWIEGESQAQLGNIVEARLAYLKMQRFSYGLVLVPRPFSKPSSFWSPFHEASIHLTKKATEPPISIYPPNVFITIPQINRLYSHPEGNYPHMTATITHPSFSQRVSQHLAVVGTVAMIPDSVYNRILFPGNKTLLGEPILFESGSTITRLDQSLRSRLLDDNVSVEIPREMYLYVLVHLDSGNGSGYIATKATIHSKLWSANLTLRPPQETPEHKVELVAVASYRELASQIDRLPSDIWPVAWTRLTTW
jgi:hypothetical protein